MERLSKIAVFMNLLIHDICVDSKQFPNAFCKEFSTLTNRKLLGFKLTSVWVVLQISLYYWRDNGFFFLPEKLKFDRTLKSLPMSFKLYLKMFLWTFLCFIEPQAKHLSFTSQQSKLPLCIQFSKSFWNSQNFNPQNIYFDTTLKA